MSLRQMQVAVDYIQDRLLLRFSVAETDELRAHITRRVLRDVWNILMSGISAGKEKEVTPSADPQAEVEAEPQDFSQNFEDANATFPLGTVPLLVGECVLQVDGNANFHISFREPRERRFDIVLDQNTLRMMCSMLKAAAATANWDLALEFSTALAGSETLIPIQEKTESAPVNKLLH